MTKRVSRPNFQLNLDPPGESLWRLFWVGAAAALGAAVSLWALAWLAAVAPRGGAYLDSSTTFIFVSILWAAAVPAYLAAKQNRPYLLGLSVLYALLGVGGGGLASSGALLLLTLMIYHRLTSRRPRYRLKH